MNFLAKHFEKIILAVCLLCLIWSIKAVSDYGVQELEKTAKASEEMSDKRKVAKGQNIVEELDEESLVTLDEMLSPRLLSLNLLTNGTRDGAGLFDGGQYVICKNPKCGYAMPFNTSLCPKCGAAQEEIGPDPLPTDDLDKDGIPDLFEKSSAPVLHYRYPYDSMADFDSDGFLNIEEYRAGTDMLDATSRPALAFLLRRFGKAQQPNLPVVLKRVKTFDSDPTSWKASLSINENPRTYDFKAGDKIQSTEYTLVSIPTNSSIVVRHATGTEYTLRLNENTPEKSYSIDFLYLGSHTKGRRPQTRDVEQMGKPAISEEDYEKMLEQREKMGGRNGGGMMDMGGGIGMMAGGPRGGGRGVDSGMMNGNTSLNDSEPPLRFRLHVGDTFVLQKIFTLADRNEAFAHPEAEGLVTEYYRILDVQPAEEEGQDVVLVQQLTDLNGEVIGTPIAVPMLDNLPMPRRPGDPASKDYFYNAPSSGVGGGMGMGMPGGIGMPGGMMP